MNDGEKKPEPLPREMLDKWANSLDERNKITEFWDWLTKKHQGVKLGLYLDEIDIEKELDEYHQINRKQLDNERRAALERHRQLTEP